MPRAIALMVRSRCRQVVLDGVAHEGVHVDMRPRRRDDSPRPAGLVQEHERPASVVGDATRDVEGVPVDHHVEVGDVLRAEQKVTQRSADEPRPSVAAAERVHQRGDSLGEADGGQAIGEPGSGE